MIALICISCMMKIICRWSDVWDFLGKYSMCFAILQQKLYPKNFKVARSSSYKSWKARNTDSLRTVMWPVNVGLNVTFSPTMLLSVYSIEWHRWCSVCDIESFFLVSNNVWPYCLFMCCSYCTFLISSFAVSLPSVSSACMFH